MRVTIAHRLGIGIGMIVILFLAADLFSLRAARQVDEALSDVVDGGEERRGAGYDMRSALQALVAAVRVSTTTGEPVSSSAVQRAQREFQRAASAFSGSASTQRSAALAKDVASAYNRVQQRVRDLGLLQARMAKLETAVSVIRRDVRAVADPPAVNESNGRAATPDERRRLRARIREQVLIAAGDGAQPESASLPDLSELIARYQRASPPIGERDWANRVLAAVGDLSAAERRLTEARGARDRALEQLFAACRALDQLLAGGVQPAAREELLAAVSKASTVAHRANTEITWALYLALLLGALAALATVRAVRAPLRRLVASTAELASGAFQHRVQVTSNDELGELGRAFNAMAARLEATTVSREYLEGIIDTMGEGLLVIGQDGTIRRANRTVENLLGYEPDSLNGEPVERIAPSLRRVASPGRFEAELWAKGGERVPVSVSMVEMAAFGAEGSSWVCIAQDLRDRLAAEQRQRQAGVVFDNTQEGVVLTDAAGRIVTVNPAFLSITGLELQRVAGLDVHGLWAHEAHSPQAAAMREAVLTEGQWQGEAWLRRASGALCPVWASICSVGDPGGATQNYVLVFSDISAIKDAESRLSHLAYHDALTDLPNRRLLSDRLTMALHRASRTASSVCVLYIDLDEFKHVNDTLGHDQGDGLLKVMAERLSATLRVNDTLARLGGDEFIVVMEDVQEIRYAGQVAEAILTAVAMPCLVGGIELRMSASIGISVSPDHGTSAEELLKAADAAMYRAKGAGRNSFQFYSAELTERALERLTLKNAIRHPEFQSQLVLRYQPQVSLRTGKIVGVEALVRWQHPTRGLLMPAQFVPIAEEAGLVHVIGEQVLAEACRQAAAWQGAGHRDLRVAVNISPAEARTARLRSVVEQILSETALPPHLLELEVTEGALQVSDASLAVLSDLKALGTKLSLDDFGTGYSALYSLKALPFDRVKIDRSFIRDMEHGQDDQALVRAIIAMAKSLGMALIAEGVETEAQVKLLREYGCDEVQGYLLGKPMSPTEIESLLPVRRLPAKLSIASRA